MSMNREKVMKTDNRYTCKALAIGVSLTAGLMMSSSVYAQSTTATIRGDISVDSAHATSGTTVVAVNINNGFTSRGIVNANGSYALAGLSPGAYDVIFSLDGEKLLSRRVIVQVGQEVDLDADLMPSEAIEEIIVTGSALASAVKSSEIGMNISRDQILNLPQDSRNFLNFAKMAPGIVMSNDPGRQQFSSGALGSSQTNYFIDGVNMKNNINTGGGVGQDSSRGSPFSQLSIEGFRVITQNFKAEYEQAGSAVITAVTRSGTNEFHAEAFGLYQDAAMVDRDEFARELPYEKNEYSRKQFGGAIGGPIINDKLHYFISYEGHRQTRNSEVALGGAANDADRARWGEYEGIVSTPFKEDLFFGKLDYQPDYNQRMELSVNVRREKEIRDVGGISSSEQARGLVNNSFTGVFKHSYSFDNGAFNEFSANYLNSRFADERQNTSNKEVYENVIILGGHTFEQVASQKSLTLRNELILPALDWNGDHLIKMGFKYANYSYLQSKLDHNNPEFLYRKDGTGEFRTRPDEVRYAPLRAELDAKNNQFGLFIQDDWEVNDKLIINLGLRYDYETNPVNTDFVTPDHLATTLRAIDALTHDQAALETFLQNKHDANGWMGSLGAALDTGITANDLAFFDAERYITDGSQRKAYGGAIQPRLGFSYDVNGDHNTIIFAGAGRYVDRTLFNFTADETIRTKNPQYTVRFSDDGAPGTVLWDDKYNNPSELDALITTGIAGAEMLLMPNDMEPVMSDQFSFGLRQKIGEFQTSITFSYIKSDNDVSYHFVNMLQKRPTLDWWQFLLEGVDPAAQVGNILVADNDRKTRSKSVYVTVDKPYTEDSNWGMSIAYTYSKAEAKGLGTFNIDFPSAPETPWGRVPNNASHRLVSSLIYGLPFDMKISGFLTYSSGERYDTFYIHDDYNPYDFIRPGEGKKDSYMPIDLRLTKEVKIGSQSLMFVVELFNAFDSKNYDYYVNWNAPWINDSGERKSIHRGSTRRMQIGASYKF